MALRSRQYGWYVIGLLTLVNFLNYSNRNIFFPMYEDLRATFAFSNSEIGLLGSAFMLTHALVSVPFGWAGDRFDRRRVLAAGIALWSVAAVASAVASSLGMLILSRALVGVGTAACVPLASALLCQVFPEQAKARIASIFNVGLFLGGGAGFGIGATLGYPGGVLLVGVPGLLLAALVYRIDVPGRGSAIEDVSFRGFIQQARELLQVRTLRWLMAGAVLMAFASGGYLAWFFEFIAISKGLGQERAFVVFGTALAGGLLGVLWGGVVADWLQRRVVFGRMAAVSLGMFCAVPFALISIYIDVGVPFYVASWLTMFFITWYHGPMVATIDDLARRDRSTTAQALVIFTMHLLGTAPSAWLVGTVADMTSLSHAMLLPTAAVLLGAVVFIGGWKSMASDRLAARVGDADGERL